MPPRAVVFDLDGTLIDSAVTATAILNRMLAKRGLPPTRKELARNWVSLGAAGLIANAFGDAAGDLNAAIAEFRALYRELPPDPAELFPHVPEMLAALTKQGIRIGICTNKPEDLARHVVKGVGIETSFQALVGGGAGFPAKPDPMMLFETLKRLGVDAADAVYVGDSEIDAETAAAAGLPFFLVSFGYAIGDAAAIACAARIDDFRDLPAALLSQVPFKG